MKLYKFYLTFRDKSQLYDFINDSQYEYEMIEYANGIPYILYGWTTNKMYSEIFRRERGIHIVMSTTKIDESEYARLNSNPLSKYQIGTFIMHLHNSERRGRAVRMYLTKQEFDIVSQNTQLLTVFMIEALKYTYADYSLLKEEYQNALDLLLYNIVSDAERDDELGDDADSLLSFGVTRNGNDIWKFVDQFDQVKSVMHIFRYTYAKE